MLSDIYSHYYDIETAKPSNLETLYLDCHCLLLTLPGSRVEGRYSASTQSKNAKSAKRMPNQLREKLDELLNSQFLESVLHENGLTYKLKYKCTLTFE